MTPALIVLGALGILGLFLMGCALVCIVLLRDALGVGEETEQ